MTQPRLLLIGVDSSITSSPGDIVFNTITYKAYRHTTTLQSIPLSLVDMVSHAIHVPFDRDFPISYRQGFGLAINVAQVHLGLEVIMELPPDDEQVEHLRSTVKLPFETVEMLTTGSGLRLRMVFNRSIDCEYHVADHGEPFGTKQVYDRIHEVKTTLVVRKHRALSPMASIPRWYADSYTADYLLFVGPTSTWFDQLCKLKVIHPGLELVRVSHDQALIGDALVPTWEENAEHRWPYWYAYIRELFIALYPVLSNVYPMLWLLDAMPHMSRWTRLRKVKCLEDVRSSIERILENRSSTSQSIKTE